MVNLSFIGDIGLNDDYVQLRSNRADPFISVSSYLSDADMVIGNLECTLKGDEGENLLKKPRISSNPDTLGYLKNLNLGLATMATNHVYDNLSDGFKKTVSFLQSKDISYIGAGITNDLAQRNFAVTLNDISFCFLNYLTSDTNPSLPENADVLLNLFSEEKCFNDLKEADHYDYRIILLHWGGRFEGGLFPDFDQIALSRRLIDKGADLIVGHHSHTLQPYDIYKGKYVFYSLGNFCFSDIRFEGKIRKMSSLRERESVILNVKFNKKGYEVGWIPFRNEELYPVIRRSVGIKFILRNACWKIIKILPFWLVYQWWFKKIRPIIVQLKRKDKNKSLTERIVYHLVRNFKKHA